MSYCKDCKYYKKVDKYDFAWCVYHKHIDWFGKYFCSDSYVDCHEIRYAKDIKYCELN